MKTNLVRRLSALVFAIGLSAGSLATVARATDRAPRDTWEYCAIVTSFGTSSKDGNAVGIVRVVYFEEAGAREDIVRFTGEAVTPQTQSTSEPFERARAAAFDKALVDLGKNGWELVGELPYGVSYTSNAPTPTALYFKRLRE